MSINDKETLSQLMDGEWQDLNPSKSVEAACADEELKATWSRYHLIRDVIRNDAIAVDTSLSSRISQAIADEPTYSNVSAIASVGNAHTDRASTDAMTDGMSGDGVAAETSSVVKPLSNKSGGSRNWGMGISGVALAACVALATVLGLNFWRGAPESGLNNPVQTVAGGTSATAPNVVIPEVEFVANTGIYWETPQPTRSAAAEQRLNMLLSAHIENSPTAERTGLLPYSRLVGYDEVQPDQSPEQ